MVVLDAGKSRFSRASSLDRFSARSFVFVSVSCTRRCKRALRIGMPPSVVAISSSAWQKFTKLSGAAGAGMLSTAVSYTACRTRAARCMRGML
eukprot:1954072-Rhodomonas_salina.1